MRRVYPHPRAKANLLSGAASTIDQAHWYAQAMENEGIEVFSILPDSNGGMAVFGKVIAVDRTLEDKLNRVEIAFNYRLLDWQNAV